MFQLLNAEKDIRFFNKIDLQGAAKVYSYKNILGKMIKKSGVQIFYDNIHLSPEVNKLIAKRLVSYIE